MVEILRTDYNSLAVAEKALLQGQVIAFPTETVYGIGVLHGNEEGLSRIQQIKGRDAKKPFQVLIPDIRYAARYASADNKFAQAFMESFWPGALTLVLPAADGTTCGLRVPVSKWLCMLMRRLDCGLIASSANYSGENDAVTVQEISKQLGSSLGLIIDGGKSYVGKPSTVVAVDEDGKLEVFREGAITQYEMYRVIEKVRNS